VIKYLLLGFWICAITLASAYATIVWQTQKPQIETAAKDDDEPVEQLQTKMITVPVLANGGLKGYVLAQFVFRINAAALKNMPVKPDIFLIDEAIKVIYSGEAIDFRNPEKRDVAKLSALIKKNVNARFGDNFVKDVLVQELNYLPQDRLRGGALSGGPSFG
jgi:hypothetical protein